MGSIANCRFGRGGLRFSDGSEEFASDLGQAKQLGDGAALAWWWQSGCWTGVKRRKAVWDGDRLSFEEAEAGEPADLPDIPKASTDLKASREEFFRVLSQAELFARPEE